MTSSLFINIFIVDEYTQIVNQVIQHCHRDESLNHIRGVQITNCLDVLCKRVFIFLKRILFISGFFINLCNDIFWESGFLSNFDSFIIDADLHERLYLDVIFHLIKFDQYFLSVFSLGQIVYRVFFNFDL